ncbi:MAG TPA: hypothetical protein VGF12_20690 [Roseateles sp.]|uniref:hypothetical protein n=1 Tax=Roseateles sp. TaxID=1971397 RepID=UPI002EDB08D3
MAADKSSRLDRLGDGALVVIEGLANVGVWGSAGVAIAMGKFLLGGALAALSLGVFLRFKRLRARRMARRG